MSAFRTYIANLTVIEADVTYALEIAQDAERDARDARLWASKEYVADADRKSESLWGEYVAMRQMEIKQRMAVK
jgi:hypothetical protein